MKTVYTDGATEGQNGVLGTVSHCGIGVFVLEDLYGYSERIEAISCNEAEFHALVKGMNICIEKGYKKVVFKLDSNIVVRRANGHRPKAKFRNERMDSFQNTVISLIKEFEEVYFEWIPREQNQVADYLSKKNITSPEKIQYKPVLVNRADSKSRLV